MNFKVPFLSAWLDGNPFAQLALVIGLTALTGTFATHQFDHAGGWQPELPDKIGIWKGTDTPYPPETLSILGNPKARAQIYTNLFQEVVSVSVVSAGSFDNFHDPTICGPHFGFGQTAKKDFAIDGPGSGTVRVQVLRRGTQRILLYYWLQNRRGTTDIAERSGNYEDILNRFRTGYTAIALGEQTCIVRVFTRIHPADPKGAQAQRNVEQIARAVYRALLPVKEAAR